MIITGALWGMLFGFGFGGSVLYCGIGLVVFMLLTAYDTQKLQQMYSYYSADAEMAEKASIYGALTLYLDFINIFLYVVRLLGHEQPPPATDFLICKGSPEKGEPFCLVISLRISSASLWAYLKEILFLYWIGVCRGLRAAPNAFSQKGS